MDENSYLRQVAQLACVEQGICIILLVYVEDHHQTLEYLEPQMGPIPPCSVIIVNCVQYKTIIFAWNITRL